MNLNSDHHKFPRLDFFKFYIYIFKNSVGTAVSRDGTFKLVLRYLPAGNVQGDYSANVGKPSKGEREKLSRGRTCTRARP